MVVIATNHKKFVEKIRLFLIFQMLKSKERNFHGIKKTSISLKGSSVRPARIWAHRFKVYFKMISRILKGYYM